MTSLKRWLGFTALFSGSLLGACSAAEPDGAGYEDAEEASDELAQSTEALVIRPGGSKGHNMDFTRCAAEGETCLTSWRYVAYGAGKRFVYKVNPGPFVCDATTFGSDPAPGREKACYYSSYGPAFSSTRGGPLVEGETGNVTGNVAYGANGVFNFKTYPAGFTSITCDDATFGDPLPGVAKA
jgi:hypothetical protein